MLNDVPSGTRVLLVEDNPAVTRPMVSIFREHGYDPKVFYAGLPALKYARSEPPAIALIDIHLPDISGLDLSQQIREACGESLPIIILSGDTSIDTLKSLPAVGATYFFSKPVNTTMLLERMKDWIAGAAQVD